MSAPVLPRRASEAHRSSRLALLLALLAGLLLVPAAPASAEELVVTITPEGVQPQVVVARAGDTVRFVNQDRSFAYRAQSTGGPWRFDSGPTTLLTDDFVVPAPLTTPGTYAYRVAQDPPYRGTVLLGGGTPTAPPPGAVVPPGGEPSVAGAVPSPSGAGSSPGGTPSATGSAPAVAPTPGGASPAPVPSVGPAAVPGSLPAPPSGRALGLPAALAAVLVVGAGSLLLRLLLAEPVLSEGAATLRRTGTRAARW